MRHQRIELRTRDTASACRCYESLDSRAGASLQNRGMGATEDCRCAPMFLYAMPARARYWLTSGRVARRFVDAMGPLGTQSTQLGDCHDHRTWKGQRRDESCSAPGGSAGPGDAGLEDQGSAGPVPVI